MTVLICPERDGPCPWPTVCGPKDACINAVQQCGIGAIGETDPTNPDHYRSHPSGVECISIVEHLNFCLGNAMKYLWRSGLKTHDPLPDLRKARWYVDREIARLEAAAQPSQPKDTGT